MNADERNRKIFDASIGCTTAAVEFLRSVNKPLNVTYIASTAWEIAKKLEEYMEVSIAKETGGSTPFGDTAGVPSKGVSSTAGPGMAKPKPVGPAMESEESELIELK